METVKFEEALKRLEKIVSDLEGGDLTLDLALKKYEEGVKLAHECTKKLQQVEKKIEVLSKELDGSFSLSELDEENEETPKSTKKSKKEKIS
jgi:exodeoxyribonuclease VII small subunit